jgi:hypothetical protein
VRFGAAQVVPLLGTTWRHIPSGDAATFVSRGLGSRIVDVNYVNRSGLPARGACALADVPLHFRPTPIIVQQVPPW